MRQAHKDEAMTVRYLLEFPAGGQTGTVRRKGKNEKGTDRGSSPVADAASPLARELVAQRVRAFCAVLTRDQPPAADSCWRKAGKVLGSKEKLFRRRLVAK